MMCDHNYVSNVDALFDHSYLLALCFDAGQPLPFVVLSGNTFNLSQ